MIGGFQVGPFQLAFQQEAQVVAPTITTASVSEGGGARGRSGRKRRRKTDDDELELLMNALSSHAEFMTRGGFIPRSLLKIKK